MLGVCVHPSGVLTAPFGCYVSGATWNCCHLGEFCVGRGHGCLAAHLVE